jgi:hypothetical protein
VSETSEGRAYAIAIVMQHLLQALERKGIIEVAETARMLEEALIEIDGLAKSGVLSHRGLADARRTIGSLYLPRAK